MIINEVVGRPHQAFQFAMPILREEKIGWCFWELMLGRSQFSRNNPPYQGLVYPDGKCYDAREVALVADVSVAEARQQFPERPRPKLEEDGITFEGFWTRWTGAGPDKGRLFYATDSESTATWTFQGTDRRPDPQGRARIAASRRSPIDGQPAARARVGHLLAERSNGIAVPVWPRTLPPARTSSGLRRPETETPPRRTVTYKSWDSIHRVIQPVVLIQRGLRPQPKESKSLNRRKQRERSSGSFSV